MLAYEWKYDAAYFFFVLCGTLYHGPFYNMV